MSMVALAEYERQLAEINEMLEEDPTDESLLQLKRDMLELISSTKETATPNDEEKTIPIPRESTAEFPAMEQPESIVDVATPPVPQPIEPSKSTLTTEHTDTNTTTTKATTKKLKKIKPPPSTFEIPPHLVPLESDTEGERNKKRRTIKTLKSKWRERVKEVAGSQKQKSWQDFVGKSKKKRNTGDSIFRTEDGVNARVGVIGSGKSMTEFGSRKRFKM